MNAWAVADIVVAVSTAMRQPPRRMKCAPVCSMRADSGSRLADRVAPYDGLAELEAVGVEATCARSRRPRARRVRRRVSASPSATAVLDRPGGRGDVLGGRERPQPAVLAGGWPHRQLEPGHCSPSSTVSSRARARATRTASSRRQREPDPMTGREGVAGEVERGRATSARPGSIGWGRHESRWVRFRSPRATSSEGPSGATSHRRAATSASGRSLASSITASRLAEDLDPLAPTARP